MKQYLPTISAIRLACRTIQAGWTEAERAQHACWAYPPMLVKRVEAKNLEDDEDDDDDEDDRDRNR